MYQLLKNEKFELELLELANSNKGILKIRIVSNQKINHKDCVPRAVAIENLKTGVSVRDGYVVLVLVEEDEDLITWIQALQDTYDAIQTVEQLNKYKESSPVFIDRVKFKLRGLYNEY